MAKTEINPYGGFTGDETNQVWQISRFPAQRYQIANLYKPSIIRFDDGEILAAPFLSGVPSEDYSQAEEYFVFFSSRDDGRTWTEVGKRIPGREARMQILKDGTLILTCHFLGQDINNKSGRCQFGFRRSYDRGRNWETEWLDVGDLQPEAKDCIASRNVLEMPDGSILLGVSSYDPEIAEDEAASQKSAFRCGNWWFKSFDGGKTWAEKTPVNIEYRKPINFPFFCETDIHRCPSGRVIAISRFSAVYPKEGTYAAEGCEQGDHLRIFSLKDDNVTWVEEREFLQYAQLHPHLLDLPDGRLLCAYTHRNFPFGTQAVVSGDEGRTWTESNPFILAWFSWDSSCGFPCSVNLDDGSVLTCYTTRRLRGLEHTEDELFAEAVRWRVPA